MTAGTDIAKIRLSGVTRSFDGVRAVDAVDLTLHPRQSLVLIGGSGSGKSLLLKCLLGLIAPDAGANKEAGGAADGMPASDTGVVAEAVSELTRAFAN